MTPAAFIAAAIKLNGNVKHGAIKNLSTMLGIAQQTARNYAHGRRPIPQSIVNAIKNLSALNLLA